MVHHMASTLVPYRLSYRLARGERTRLRWAHRSNGTIRLHGSVDTHPLRAAVPASRREPSKMNARTTVIRDSPHCVTRCQEKGPKVVAVVGWFFVFTFRRRYSRGRVLPWTTTRWKLGTS